MINEYLYFDAYTCDFPTGKKKYMDLYFNYGRGYIFYSCFATCFLVESRLIK